LIILGDLNVHHDNVKSLTNCLHITCAVQYVISKVLCRSSFIVVTRLIDERQLMLWKMILSSKSPLFVQAKTCIASIAYIKTEELCCLPLSSVSGSERTGFGVSEVALSRSCGYITVAVQSDVPLPLHMHAAVFATGFVDDALRNTVQSVKKPLLHLVNAVFRFFRPNIWYGGKLRCKFDDSSVSSIN